MLLGQSQRRAPPGAPAAAALPELKPQAKAQEAETPYTESPFKLHTWETDEDLEEEEEASAPLPQAEHVGWVARERKDDTRAVDRSNDFLALLQEVRAGSHALERRWDLVYLLVPGFFRSKYPSCLQDTQKHLEGLGLHCRVADVGAGGSVRANAEAIAAAAEELSVLTSKRVVLVGHSRGGCDAVAAVARHGARLRQRVAGVLCLQAPLGGAPLAGDFVAKRLRGRVLRTARYVLGGEVEALAEVTYESRREELDAFPYPYGTIPLVTFASETHRKGSLLEPLAAHTRRRYQEVANDGLVACPDAHLPFSTKVDFTADWDHAACAFRDPSLKEREELVNEALMALLVQEVPTMGPSVDTSLVPVYDFWNRSRREHTFHAGDAWAGERKERVAFYAFRSKVEGTEPVCSFWNKEYSVHTFHTGEPLKGESKQGVQFYAYALPTEGAEAVYSFWHEENADCTIHMGEPASGEARREVLFYALRHPGHLDPRRRPGSKIDRV